MKKLLATTVLTCLLAITCMAQDLCIPGQTQGPPCMAAQQSDDPETAATVDGFTTTDETTFDSLSADLVIELLTLSLW